MTAYKLKVGSWVLWIPPLMLFPGLKGTSHVAESWHHHHIHPLVITDPELAVSSESMTETLIPQEKGPLPKSAGPAW